MNPLISIIIPAYNRAHLIGETLDSIIAQTYKNWECIIVDDGSNDDTEEVIDCYLKKDNRFKFYHRPLERGKGPNACRNYGFELSKGHYVQFFDSDDCMKPNCLKIKIDNFTGSIDLVVCKLSFFDFENKIDLKQNQILSNDLLYDYFCGKVALYISGPLWLKDFLKHKVKLFDESIINCDDWDFNMRMLYDYPSFKMIDQSLILYRIHSASLSFGILNNNFEEIKNVSNLLDKHLVLLGGLNNISIRKYVKYAIQFNKYYLLQSILIKHSFQYFLIKRVFKYCFKYCFLIDFFKVIIGKVSFSLTNKGAIFFK